MHDWMTSRHEGCVSTMLTDKRLEYCTAGVSLQEVSATKWRVQADKHALRGAFRLDNARVDPLQPFGRYVASPLKPVGQGKRVPRVAERLA
jgi:hypothetical protein